MEIIKTEIQDLLTIKPRIFKDDRGYFFESYNFKNFREIGLNAVFVQDNESCSMKNVLRGLHFQKPPFSQGKLVRVIRGSVLDVAVDLRKKSSTYGKWASVVLSDKNKLMYWIPEGFAHGFLTLEDNTIFFYKCTNVYNPESELSLRWNDPTLNIDWGITGYPILSEKDKVAPLFSDFVSPF
ncbi:MAG: dTDP-4-dehydrorhamnose 3,5-epimerase [Bacteroidales bacterium]|jgi:dTDP-4-dehydrorhamnose 3,5-epimerase|nr:dTDP-4-dehydrorhamnose 3,5-epimerase [Bacteroidales bacterium]MDI9591714.1 dTDP-4-dehydrorhamnose 3,5-epimerase [Bacteroidota bacterium]NLH33616.1 dTDP-4-dehydrorhamnose 3,5-epimerase [Lentimicrobium sp.]MBP7873365.1 dTDP-4-dehydrorhamnose 3,5-epimerase [Bacteroidales bacterium]MCO6468463.1 dTDP-4-dehydrorhamnose 3,5-epimerase [Bacteroidales bacterium]